MKSKHLLIFVVILVTASLLTGCSGNAFIPAGWPSITVEEDTAYVASGQFVHAVRVTDGTELWHYPEKGNASKTFYAAPAVSPDRTQLVAGSYDKFIYSLDPATGAEKWPYQTGGHIIANPVSTEQGIFAPSADHKLYALDPNGRLRWSFETGGAQWAQPLVDEAQGVLYLSSMDHNLYAISLDNGANQWKRDLGGAVVGTPASNEDGSILYVGTFGNQMHAINSADGSIAWTTDVKGWVWSGPAFHQGRLYFGDLNGHFYAIDAVTGAILWETPPNGPITATPLVTDELLYYTTEAGSVVALNHNGAVQWNQPVGGNIHTSPVMAGDLILVAPAGTDSRLVALNPNGTLRWTFTPSN